MRNWIILGLLVLAACTPIEEGVIKPGPIKEGCPDAKYISTDADECTRIMFMCAEGEPFYNDCGCGCTLI